MTEELYLVLESLNYKKKQIWQLLFLFDYLNSVGKESDFETYLNELTTVYSHRQMEQIIKCITHNTPYKVLLHSDLSWKRMNELRRYLEDSLSNVIKGSKSYNEYLHIAEKMICDDWDSHCIYELRRFVKGKHILSSTELLQLYDFISNNKIVYWQILSFLYNVFEYGSYYLFDSLKYIQPLIDKLFSIEKGLSLDANLIVLSKSLDKYIKSIKSSNSRG